MAGPLAVPTFRSKPDDKYAAVDVYTKRDNAVVNNIEDVLTRSAGSIRTSDLLNSMRGGKAAGNLLSIKGSIKNNIIDGITKGALTEGKGMLDRLGTAAGLSKVVGNLSPSLQALVSAKLSGNSYSVKSALVGAAGNLAKVGISSLPALGDLSETLTKWTGVAGLKIDDPNALGAFGSALVTQGLRNGSSGVLTAIAGQLNAGGVMKQVVKDILPDVKKFANLDALKEMVGLSPEPLAGLDKNLLADLSAKMPVPEFPLSGIEYEEKFKTVKDTFDTIEPSWNVHTHYIDIVLEDGTYMTKEQSLFDASKIVVASPEFKKTVEVGALASTDPKDKLMLVAAKVADNRSAEQKVRDSYPGVDIPDELINNGYYEKGFAKSAGISAMFKEAGFANSADPRNVAVSQKLTKEETATTAKPSRPKATIQKEIDLWYKERDAEWDLRVTPVDDEMTAWLKKGGTVSDLYYRGLKAKLTLAENSINAKYAVLINPLDTELRGK